ncbi:MAG: glycosyltransferase family 4 protein, partial [Alicyclobacillaceae bacterium]|nr:glycosyltransferase family 4 protein [Alicyclobacillaceae bacterium]
MQVAVVAPDDLPIPPVKGGSVQIYLWHVCRLLAGARDVTVTLLSPGRHPSPELSSHLPVAVRNRRERRRTYRALILTELKQIGPDIVHVDNRPDLVPAVRVACPDAKVVLNLHSGTFLGPRHLAPTAARDILCSADAVVCNSRFLQRRIARHFRLETGAWHPVVIYPGVDVAQFTPLAAAGHAQNGRASPVLSTGRPVRPEGLRVLYVGRVIQGKGVHVLVEAVRQLRRRGVPVT